MSKPPDFELWLDDGADRQARDTLKALREQWESARAQDKADADELLRIMARRRNVVDHELVVARQSGQRDRTRALAEEAEELEKAERVQKEVRGASEFIEDKARRVAAAAEQPLREQHGAEVLVPALVAGMEDWLGLADQVLRHYGEYRRCVGAAGGSVHAAQYPIPKDGLAREILKLVAQRRGVALQG